MKDDAPKPLADVMRRFASHRAFQLKKDPVRDGVHRLWVDMDSLLKLDQTGIREGILAAVRRYVPLAVTHVVTLADEASRQVASIVCEAIKASTGQVLTPIEAGMLKELAVDTAEAVVVTAACIGSGNALQDVSRDLRDRLGAKPRIYLTALAKHVEAPRHDAFVSDLRFNNLAHRHEVVFLDTLSLPDRKD